MRFTRARDLVLAAVIAAVVVNVFLVLEYATMPPLPIFAGAFELVLGIAELVLAFVVRSRVSRKGTRPLSPVMAVRTVALAKASSVLGALMCGAWVAVLIYVVPRRASVQVAGGDTTAAAIGLVCSALLVGAALWLEYCCRRPIDRDDQHGSERSRSA